jgi:phosphatidate cytidylyltransferase
VADGPPKSTTGIRVVSALILAPPVLAALYFGRPYFDLLVGLAAIGLGFEWDRLCGGKPFDPTAWILALTGAAAVAAVSFGAPQQAPIIVLLGAIVVYFMGRGTGRRAALPAGIQGQRWLAAGALYIGLPCAALVWLRADGAGGRDLVLWLFLTVWAVDIGAYFAGRSIGGPKLAPAISPNKTWSGLVGGMLSAALVGGIAAALLGKANLWPLAAFGAFLAVVEQAGDLLESWIKRRFSVKDMGHLIPGHGGLFDRVDGLLAVGAVTALAAVAAGGDLLRWL